MTSEQVIETEIDEYVPTHDRSFHQSHVKLCPLVQCLTQPIMTMPLSVVKSWLEQAVSNMGHTSICCMVCLMQQSQVSGSFEYHH